MQKLGGVQLSSLKTLEGNGISSPIGSTENTSRSLERQLVSQSKLGC